MPNASELPEVAQMKSQRRWQAPPKMGRSQ
jgi:hypothetical protein